MHSDTSFQACLRALTRFALGAALMAAGAPVFAQAAAPAPADDGAAPVWLYTVRPGDTLIGLGRRYLREPAQWTLVQRDNRVADPRAIPSGTVLRIPAALLRQQPASARLVRAYGLVRWRANAQADWGQAHPGQRLEAGAEVQAGQSGSAVIELANGTRLSLQPDSLLSLDTLSQYAGGLMADTRLRLQRGRIDIQDNPGRKTNQNLRILTPSAQAVVRGTRFRVGVEADATREETLDGAVDLQAAGRGVRVGAGRGSLARKGQPPLPPVRLLPAPDVSGLPSRFEQLPLQFPLPSQAGAAAWFGQVSAQGHPAHVLLQTSTSATTLGIADLPDGRYVLRLRAVDANGLQGFDATHPFTVLARPFFPLLIAPADKATVRKPRPELVWSKVVGVARSRLQVASEDDFARTLFDVERADTAWTPPHDLPAGRVFWRVASIAADGRQGPWSKPQSFIYKPGPGPVDLDNAALRFDSDHLLLELPPAPAGQHYALTLSDHAGLQPALATARSGGGAVSLPRPSGGKRYLGARLVDDGDGTAGPPAVHAINVPARYPGLWLLLIPLLPAL